MVFEHQSYRTFLKAVLAQRKSQNRAYSLNAMARALRISPALLSSVNRGKKNLSFSSAHGVAQQLGLDPRETEYFCKLVLLEGAGSKPGKPAAPERPSSLDPQRITHDLSLDAFHLISDWYHIPILELTRVPDLVFTPKEIARRLGISPIEAEAAIERLLRLGLLDRDQSGRYRRVHENLMIESKPPNGAIQRYHRQMLQKASDCLETQTNDEKYVASEIFAADARSFSQAKQMIDRFAEEVIAFFNRGRKPKHVYQLGIQLFNLTKEGETR